MGHGDNHTGKDANGTGTGTDILTQMFGPSCGARSPTASTNGTVNNANVMTHLSGPSHGAQAAERQLANQPTLRLGPSTWAHAVLWDVSVGTDGPIRRWPVVIQDSSFFSIKMILRSLTHHQACMPHAACTAPRRSLMNSDSPESISSSGSIGPCDVF
jgi:hypothetical protein